MDDVYETLARVARRECMDCDRPTLVVADALTEAGWRNHLRIWCKARKAPPSALDPEVIEFFTCGFCSMVTGVLDGRVAFVSRALMARNTVTTYGSHDFPVRFPPEKVRPQAQQWTPKRWNPIEPITLDSATLERLRSVMRHEWVQVLIAYLAGERLNAVAKRHRRKTAAWASQIINGNVIPLLKKDCTFDDILRDLKTARERRR